MWHVLEVVCWLQLLSHEVRTLPPISGSKQSVGSLWWLFLFSRNHQSISPRFKVQSLPHCHQDLLASCQGHIVDFQWLVLSPSHTCSSCNYTLLFLFYLGVLVSLHDARTVVDTSIEFLTSSLESCLWSDLVIRHMAGSLSIVACNQLITWHCIGRWNRLIWKFSSHDYWLNYTILCWRHKCTCYEVSMSIR